LLLDLLRLRAEERPGHTAYTFLPDRNAGESSITYSELETRAKSIGGMLQEMSAEAERILLLYPPGLDYIAAFFGCLYAGAVAIPAYPPRPNQSLQRLRSIARNADARFALTTGTVLSRIMTQGIQGEGLDAVRWIDTDCLGADAGDNWRYPALSGDNLALIQYTSGSTGDPKGVMLSHENLLSNSAMLSEAFEYGPESVCVSWLPVYHDMGLIGGILQPLYGGFSCVLMPPASFLQRPVRWLEAISQYQATISGAPNFAYDLCARRISPEQRADLDLSSWSIAFTGSEPIRKETLDRFSDAFKPCGFRRQSFFPCYGLAEATLFVTGGPKALPPLVRTVRASELENNRVVDVAPDDPEARAFISCGRKLPDQKIVVVHPDSMTRCEPDEIGEVWVSGRNVAKGYWGWTEQTQETFSATLIDTGEGPFLRTGDLGFVREGELFLAGRLKDLIIVRGLNHYPQDIEHTMQASHPGLEPNSGAAFSVDVAGEERLVVIQEIKSRLRSESDEILELIRSSIAASHELQAYSISLIKRGTLPKTTSGKVQRHVCRSMYLNGELTTVAEWRAAELSQLEPINLDFAPDSCSDIQGWLVQQVAARVGQPRGEIDVDRPLTHFGLDSLSAIELAHALEEKLDLKLSAARLLGKITIVELAHEAMAKTGNGEAGPVERVVHAPETYADHPLSFGQQAMWYLHQLAPDSPAYNIATAIRIKSPVDVEALERSFSALILRHASLRTTFTAENGKPVQRIASQTSFAIRREDATSWSHDELQGCISEQSREPFDLESGPLIRVGLFAIAADEQILLLVVHHIVADFWSLAILMREMGIFYQAELDSAHAMLPNLEVEYTDYARWQAEALEGSEGQRLWRYWQERLGGASEVLDLPTDRARPPAQGHHGASHTLRLDADLTKDIKSFSRKQDVTLYVTLVATLQSLLYRYTSQPDLSVGSLMAGRNLPEVRPVVGYFVNPVVLRADFDADPSFDDFLGQAQESVLGALEHQGYPFPLLVERLHPQRDASRSPLFQVMFMLQKAHLLDQEGLTAFALGESGASLEVAGLDLESVALEQRVAQFDLTVVMAETNGTLGISLQYDTELFEESTIKRMSGHLQTLLSAIVENSARRISDLPILSATESNQILVDWNKTQAIYETEMRVHDLFESQAARFPEGVAVVFNDRQVTYGELNLQANRIARRLVSLGVGPEVPVGICVERSSEMMAGLLGILKAGGAYVPLDPSYPRERINYVLDDARITVLVTQQRLRHLLPEEGTQVILLDGCWDETVIESDGNFDSRVTSSNAAYTIYTSGSTGKPKGVTITHRSIVNFFRGMDSTIGCDSADTLMAVTSISFDISVLELLWTLANGAKVVIGSQESLSGGASLRRKSSTREMKFSLFYFANEDPQGSDDKYRLLIEGAKFADRNGFSAVWTPERHFHAFGGLYPNPAVTSAALAVITEQIHIRAGSVVLPLHNVLRVAEDWSLVDNLSKGRVGIAFASGWHSDDFVFFPENYPDRKQVMLDGIEAVKKLWRGESIAVRSGSGKDIEVRVFPRPIQPELPIWLTAAGSPETFIKAGEMGANILTHLLGQSVDEVLKKVAMYRDALDRSGHGRESGKVALMLHTFVGENREHAREIVRKPFTNYLRTSIDLIGNLIKSMNLPLKLEEMTEKEMGDLLDYAFNRYFETSALFGSPADCEPMIERLKEMGIDEVACLIDFGVDVDSALAALPNLSALKDNCNKSRTAADYPLVTQVRTHKPTLLQCTPSMMSMLMLDPDVMESLGSLRVLMLGGEELPPSLVKRIREKLSCRIVNMYGPTETTIWSATQVVDHGEDRPSIGRPIANTEIHILDQRLRPVPAGISGELCIGGDGLARGYFNQPGMTADRFIPNPLGTRPGARLYRTGDRASYLPDGRIEFIGRLDQQVKLRGFRIELGEIEAALGQHSGVKEAVAAVREDDQGDKRLVAYVVAQPGSAPGANELRDFLRETLPEYMMPSAFATLTSLPLTPNGKVDRKALPRPESAGNGSVAVPVMPRNKLEQAIAEVWKEVLKTDRIGINDNFFDIGGHSLLMAQAHSRLQEVFCKKLPLIKMLEHSTVSSLARYLGEEQDQNTNFEQSRSRALKQREGLRRQSQAFAKRRH